MVQMEVRGPRVTTRDFAVNMFEFAVSRELGVYARSLNGHVQLCGTSSSSTPR